MKNIILIFLVFLGTIFTINAQVAINASGSAPNSFSMLDVNGTQKGILIPRITTSDRAAMAGSMGTSEEGLTVYDTDTQSFWFWNGTSWQSVGSGTLDKDWFKEGTVSPPTAIGDNMFHIGKVAIGTNVTNNHQLELYSDNVLTLLNAKLENPDNNLSLRNAGYFDVNGLAISTTGKVGVVSTVGGNPGNANNAILEAYEALVTGENGVNNPQYAFRSTIAGNNSATHFGIYNDLTGAGTGVRFGSYNTITGDGTGVQYGSYIKIDNTGDEKKAGTFNEISSTGGGTPHGHIGTVNLLGGTVTDYSDPINTLTAVSGDGSGKRIGTSNIILGDGDGTHYTESNVILSTGNGLHVGISNILGYDYVHNTNTSTSGKHIGTINNLTDTGAEDRVGELNILGLISDPSGSTPPTPVSGDSNAKRVGEMNVVGGDGNGNHYGEVNNIVSTGTGEHIGVSNVIGITGAGTPVVVLGSSKFIGIENIIGGVSTGDHYAAINHIVSAGDGIHIAAMNKVEGAGNGLHIGSYNKVSNAGSGVHIAVYGEVDTADTGALAGAFKGYTTSNNQVSTINLYSAAEYNVTNTTLQDLYFVEAGFDPTIYNKVGMVEIKVVIRVTEANGIGNEFQLTALNNSGTSSTIVSTADTWTWTETDTTNHKYIVTSEWKSWTAGTDIWELHLQGKRASSLKFDNVYVLVRPKQL